MTSCDSLSRRSFLATVAAASAAPAIAQKKRPTVGLELYSVRDHMKDDVMGTVRAVAKMGYEGVEFYSPYFDWTPAYTKEVRNLLNDLGMPCLSTHNSANAFTAENVGKAIELNGILGSQFIVMASAGRIQDLDGWKGVADRLSAASAKMKPAGFRAGFHNHQVEFRPIEGTRPMDVLAKNTPKDVVLQLDVGTCVEVGVDPVKWIQSNPGRIASIHCKDWSPERGYKVLFGEGVAPWKQIFQAAEKTGGVEHYLIEQEGSDYPSMETAERCLANFKKMRA
jgi:sugar phosphate isomerase/epimerase